MQALILVAPRCLPCQRRARQLEDELRWRNFQVQVQAADPERGHDLGQMDLAVLVFPAVVLPGLSFPLGSAGSLLRSLRGLEHPRLAMLAISPFGLDAPLDRFGRKAVELGGCLVAIRTTPPAGPRRGVIDLAAECMARVTG